MRKWRRRRESRDVAGGSDFDRIDSPAEINQRVSNSSRLSSFHGSQTDCSGSGGSRHASSDAACRVCSDPGSTHLARRPRLHSTAAQQSALPPAFAAPAAAGPSCLNKRAGPALEACAKKGVVQRRPHHWRPWPPASGAHTTDQPHRRCLWPTVPSQSGGFQSATASEG